MVFFLVKLVKWVDKGLTSHEQSDEDRALRQIDEASDRLKEKPQKKLLPHYSCALHFLH